MMRLKENFPKIRLNRVDDLVKSLISKESVIPAEAGIQ